jgi:hypothetical protein
MADTVILDLANSWDHMCDTITDSAGKRIDPPRLDQVYQLRRKYLGVGPNNQ